jgi:hypothetical protein
MFKSALQPGTYKNYGSALTGFIEFYDETRVNPREDTPVEIARYIAWLGKRGTIAAGSLQPYLLAIYPFSWTTLEPRWRWDQ